MTESNIKTPEGMHTITPHIVVNHAAGAADRFGPVRARDEFGRSRRARQRWN